jgi:hypothetical protein
LLQYFFYNNIHNKNYYIAGHDAADDDDDDDDDNDGCNVDGDSFTFQMLSIDMLTMILKSNMITTAITHMPALAFSRMPL